MSIWNACSSYIHWHRCNRKHCINILQHCISSSMRGKGGDRENKACVSSTIHSARPTVSPVTNIVFAWNFCFARFWKMGTDERKDHMCENCNNYRPWLWVGLVDQKVDLVVLLRYVNKQPPSLFARYYLRLSHICSLPTPKAILLRLPIPDGQTDFPYTTDSINVWLHWRGRCRMLALMLQ